MTRDSETLSQWLRRPEAPVILNSEELADRFHWPSSRIRAGLAALTTLGVRHVNGHAINPWASATPDVLAARLHPYGYVSGTMALSVQNVLSQMPTLIVVVDPTQEPYDLQWMTDQSSIECWQPIPEWSPQVTDLAWALPVASPAQALLDWTYHRWYVPGYDAERLTSFLDDCDREDVEDGLMAWADQADHLLVRSLAQTILEVWPRGESRFPVGHPGHHP